MSVISIYRIVWFPFIMALLLLAPYYSSHAAENIIAPQQIEGVTRVDAEGVIERISEISDLIFIDARIRTDRAQGYIEGSISLPDEVTDCHTLEKVIPAYTTPVLFYCNGEKCGRSVISSRIAKQCGYKAIYWFRGGIEEWKNKHYPLIKSESKE